MSTTFPEIIILTLSERRKADRSQMARILADKCRQAGATAVVDAEGSDPYAKHCTRLSVFLNGFAAWVDFDGKSVQPNTFVVPWHAESGIETKLSDMFGVTAGGNVNQYHRQKCTAVAYGFDDLVTKVISALQMLADGSAFL